ncbi:uncharacterized protein LOC127833865 isoform X2 [Dreissena polymorpha]|uniref:uncharacterized protein LOC127833865 isoform X2 n=1 Tax=Dreissena polymorpha TaxID=45954 RepID=UPI00226507D2|nr:uncharacterized protein LOC127833865 isoform X2 [Dreissena polymorpha]
MDVVKTVLLVFVLCIGFSFQYPYDDCTGLGYEEVYANVGDYITLECNTSSINGTIYGYLWQIPRHRSNSGPKWHHFTVDKEYAGLYKCFVFTKEGDILVDEVCVSIYEVVIKWFKTPETLEWPDFNLEFEVEGIPHPVTKLTNSKTGVLVAQVNSSGVQNMTFRMVTCVENGQYQLTASNTYSNDSSMINITVRVPPRPDPKFPVAYTLSRRIGQIAKFEEHILGCPQPTFTWTHGNLSYSTGTKNISYTANTVYVSSFKDFGVYKLEIENNAGMYRTYFTLLADGQPDAAADIEVFNITDTSVILDFQPGFNYNKEQVFKIHIETSRQETEIDMLVNDTTNGIGGSRQNCTVSRLEPGTDYKLTIFAYNKEGYADPSSAVYFRTEGSTKTGSMLITIIVCASAGLVIILVLTVLTIRKRKRSGPTMDSMKERTSLTTSFVDNDYASLFNAGDAASLGTHDKDIITMDIILKVIGLGHLIEQFRRKAVGPNEVLVLSNDDMIYLGVTAIGQKIRLLRACRNYLSEGTK